MKSPSVSVHILLMFLHLCFERHAECVELQVCDIERLLCVLKIVYNKEKE